MAWISVHDHVDGPKLRRFSKAIGSSKAEALGILNYLWFWGLNNANEDGKIEDADRSDIESVFAGITRVPANKVVDSLFSSGWIDEVGGQYYLHDWAEWQNQWYKFKKKQKYDSERYQQRRSSPPQEHREPEPPAQPPKPEIPAEGHGEEPSADPEKKKKGKPERKTVKMADFVHLTPNEYQKLCDEYGIEAAKAFVRELDLYKGSKGKAYKDDYRAILSWVVDRVKEKYPGLIITRTVDDGGNPFKEFEGGMSDG